jgi:hypothetical protein
MAAHWRRDGDVSGAARDMPAIAINLKNSAQRVTNVALSMRSIGFAIYRTRYRKDHWVISILGTAQLSYKYVVIAGYSSVWAIEQ